MFGIGDKKYPPKSYKGVRDFYPADQAVQDYIFGVMSKVARSWGYDEYSASFWNRWSFINQRPARKLLTSKFILLKIVAVAKWL